MDFTFWSFVFALLPLAIPLYFVVTYRLTIERQLVKALAWFLAVILLMGSTLTYVVGVDKPWLTIVVSVLLIVLLSAGTLLRIRLGDWRLMLSLLLGVFLPVVVFTFYIDYLVMGGKHLLDARVLLPLVGLLTGGSIDAVGSAMVTYRAGLQHHAQLYYYLLGNGATHREAVYYLERRALTHLLMPTMRRMSRCFVAAAPAVFWIAMASGVSVMGGVCLELALLFSCASIACLALFITLLLSRRYAFDAYERFRPKAKQSTKAAAVAAESTTAPINDDEPVDGSAYDYAPQEERS